MHNLPSVTQPDSQKGLVEQAGDKMKSAMDSGAAAMQPNVSSSLLSAITLNTNPLILQQSQKSGSQRAADSMSGNSNDQVSSKSSFFLQEYWPFFFLAPNKDSMLNKAKNAVGMGGNNNNM